MSLARPAGPPISPEGKVVRDGSYPEGGLEVDHPATR